MDELTEWNIDEYKLTEKWRYEFVRIDLSTIWLRTFHRVRIICNPIFSLETAITIIKMCVYIVGSTFKFLYVRFQFQNKYFD